MLFLYIYLMGPAVFTRPDGSIDPVVAPGTGTGFESLPGRMFVIVVAHIGQQFSRLFKGMECAVLTMVGEARASSRRS